MNDETEKTNWPMFFATLSDKGLEEIMDHAHRERVKRDHKKYDQRLPPLSAQERQLVARDEWLDAIKQYRERTYCSLREAKYVVDCFRG